METDNLNIYDCKYILQVLISHKLIGGYLTFDKNGIIKGLYEFKPKGKKSFYINQSNLLIKIHNQEIEK